MKIGAPTSAKFHIPECIAHALVQGPKMWQKYRSTFFFEHKWKKIHVFQHYSTIR